MREIDCVLYFVGFFLTIFLAQYGGNTSMKNPKLFFGRRKREYGAAMEAIVVVLFAMFMFSGWLGWEHR